MNFLDLVRKVDELSLIQGQVDSVTPTSGFQTSMVGAVQRANIDLHLFRKDWLFNYTTIEVPLRPLVNSYTPSGIRYWEGVYHENRVLREVGYHTYLINDWTENPSKPCMYTKAPDKTLIFNTSNDNYIVKAHGYLLPDSLTSNTDIPRIPSEYHLLIVYKALEILGSSVYLGNLIEQYMKSYDEMLGQMMRDYLPSRSTKRRPLV